MVISLFRELVNIVLKSLTIVKTDGKLPFSRSFVVCSEFVNTGYFDIHKKYQNDFISEAQNDLYKVRFR